MKRLPSISSLRGASRWLPTYLSTAARRGSPRPEEPVHLLLCLADHYEPRCGGASPTRARWRVERWVRDYPRRFGSLADSDGRPPQHTFFHPLEEYDPEHLDGIAELCRGGFGEVEVHLHHDHDDSASLRHRLLDHVERLAYRHGLLSRERSSGELRYGFIHGNWALDNSRPDGRWCGVNDELDVLRETGCYADFTLPSAPSETQTRTINRIYYARDDPQRPRSHDRGVPLVRGPSPDRSLLMIQGPLLLDWRRRRHGVLPRLENGCLQANQTAHIDRLDAWLRARVQVPDRPDWFFVKLYTHGAPEANAESLLGEPQVEFHRALARRTALDPNFRFHYVTAREMYNLAIAAAAGWTGPVDAARDFRLLPVEAARPPQPHATPALSAGPARPEEAT